jgi:CheY-like chemotaxis protein
MNGYTLLMNLPTADLTNVLAIAPTGSARPDDHQCTQSGNFDEQLRKSFQLDTFIQALARTSQLGLDNKAYVSRREPPVHLTRQCSHQGCGRGGVARV